MCGHSTSLCGTRLAVVVTLMHLSRPEARVANGPRKCFVRDHGNRHSININGTMGLIMETTLALWLPSPGRHKMVINWAFDRPTAV